MLPVWTAIGKWFVKSWKFPVPAWSAGVATAAYSPGERVRFRHWINPFYWLLWLTGFLYQWIVSRPYTSLVPALPVIVIVATFSLFGLRQYLEQSDWRGTEYRTVLADALKREDDALARLALVNLTFRYPERAEYRMQQAIIEEKLGNDALALKIIQSLAATKRDSMAALWLITKQFSFEDLGKWTPEKHQQFRQLMDIALKDVRGPNKVAAHTIMANYLLAVGAPREALQHLQSVAGKDPDALLRVAGLYAEIGDRTATKKWAERSLLNYEEQQLTSSNDKELRLNLARALILLEREEEAHQRLSEMYAATGDQNLAQASGEALVAWANRIRDQEPATQENLIRRLALVKRAIDLAPKSAVVLDAVIQVTIQCAEDQSEQVATVRQALLQGVDAENMHFIEGTVELLRGNIEKADAHLALAAIEHPELPGVLNNMAVALYQRSSPDYEKALALSNSALDRLDHPYFRETRGQILLKLKEYNRAILDLEAALKAPELAGPVHESLAVAYSAVGEEELSEQHRVLAKTSVLTSATH